MGIAEIIMLIVGLATVAATVGVGVHQSTQNKQATDQANETNLQIARETNQANVEQANIAYQRSLPINQVKNLMDAGMSRAGAFNVLSGGGSYTAPTLQGASVQPETMDLSSVTSALGRLNDIPGNVQQASIVNEQRKALVQQTAQREQMFKTDMQIKGQELLSKKLDNIGNMYGQREKRETDELANAIVDAMYKSGRDIDSFDSEATIYDLMHDNDLFKNATNTARQNAIDIARQRKQDKNVNRAALDKHLIDTQAYKDAKMHAEQWKKEQNARDKETKLREMKADYEQLVAESGLAREELEHSINFYRDDNGKLHANVPNSVSADFNAFWNMVFSIIPVDALIKIVGKALK